MLSDALRARAPEPRPAAVPAAGDVLQARLCEVVAEAAAPEEALEPALRLLLEGTGASAGAICFYDQRAEVLRLAAEAGLSDDGCRRLRTVRRGDAAGWDMPLQSLFNRRAYLIESAARNRYVPPLVEQAAAVRAIACLPLYAGATPLGSLILVTLAGQGFTERDLRALEKPVRELVRLIEAVHQRVAVAPARSAPAPAPSPLPRMRVTSVADVDATGPLRAERDEARALATERGRELDALRTRFEERERDLAAARGAADAARAAADEARRLADGRERELRDTAEALADVRDTLARREGELAEARDLAESCARAVTEGRALLESRDAELASLRSRPAEETSTLPAECDRLRTALARAEESLAETVARLGTAESRTAEVEVALAAAEARAAELAAALDERPVVTAAADAPEPEPAVDERVDETIAAVAEPAPVVEAEPTPAVVEPEPAPVVETEPTPVVDGTAAALAAPAAEPPAAALPPDSRVVIDEAAHWTAADDTVVLRAPAAVADVGGTPATATLLVNLAASGALGALAELRAGGCRATVRGCVADTASGRGLPLGPIEASPLPLDLDTMLAALEPHLVRGMRVVTVGTEVDVLMSLRQALARQGVSVSMAWDAKQAADLFAMIRPALVILDLGLPQYEGYKMLVRLGGADPVPLTFVLPGADDAVGFAAALVDPAHTHRLVPLARLLPPRPASAA